MWKSLFDVSGVKWSRRSGPPWSVGPAAQHSVCGGSLDIGKGRVGGGHSGESGPGGRGTRGRCKRSGREKLVNKVEEGCSVDSTVVGVDEGDEDVVECDGKGVFGHLVLGETR